jgi:hypothetical protein
MPDLGAALFGGGEQPVLLALHVRVVRLDGGGQQSDVEPPRRGIALGHHRVEPGCVDLAGDEFRPVQQVE